MVLLSPFLASVHNIACGDIISYSMFLSLALIVIVLSFFLFLFVMLRMVVISFFVFLSITLLMVVFYAPLGLYSQHYSLFPVLLFEVLFIVVFFFLCVFFAMLFMTIISSFVLLFTMLFVDFFFNFMLFSMVFLVLQLHLGTTTLFLCAFACDVTHGVVLPYFVLLIFFLAFVVHKKVVDNFYVVACPIDVATNINIPL
jgi:hypothetical protein